jgi:RNA-directed DNA polymerase
MQSHSLMTLLTDVHRLKRAARQCMRRRSSPGADGITWRAYRQGLDDRLANLAHRLKTGSWMPGPAKLVNMRGFTGTEFPVNVPTTEDRIVHRAMLNCIEPILEARAFLDFVSCFRPGRNRLTSVRQAMRHFAAGLTYVADIDVSNVSGNVTADDAVDWLARWISDGPFLSRVRLALAALPNRALCQGSGLAPLLINLRLVPADELLKHLAIVRFADNYCVFCRSASEAEQAFDLIRSALKASGLAPSAAKSGVRVGVNPEDLFLLAG